ncbi:MAG TPA: DMT family transporter [archaeon]|nr:DMT family transporter [archaeon]
MEIETGLLLAFGAMVCWGIGDFLIQRSVRKVGDVEALAFIGIVGAIGLLPFVAGELPALFLPENLLLMLFLGIVTFIAALLNFEALKKGKLSVVEVVIEIELPVTAFLGIYFLKEVISLPQLIGIGVVFIGITMLAMKSLSLKSLGKVEKGVLLAVAAAIGMGMTNFLTGFGAKTVSPLLAIWAPWVFFTIFCLFYLWKNKGLGKLVTNAGRYKGLVLAMGIFDTLAWLLYALALKEQSIAITTAITESYPAIGMALGLWFNKEKIKRHQIAGALLALAASIALATTL